MGVTEFDEAYNTLRTQADELVKVTTYEARYDLFEKAERDYSQFNLSGSPTLPEIIDLEIRPVQFDYPDTAMLAATNHNIFAARFRRHLLTREFIIATRWLSKWRSLWKDTQTLYGMAFEVLLKDPEVSSLKNADSRRAEIHSRIQAILTLKAFVEKFYDKEGNYVVGESVAYRNAVQAAIENLDSQLISDNKQLDVFQKMKDMGMGAA